MMQTDHKSNIKANRPLMRDTVNAPSLLTNRQFQWLSLIHISEPTRPY